MSKIDVHAHIVPPAFRKALEDAGGDPSGWIIPDWTPELAIEAQNALGVTASVLSVTSPGCLFLDAARNAALARECNEYSASVQKAHPTRFSFYANLPDVFSDWDGALKELNYAFDVLGAEGVCLFPQYDGNYLGHSAFNFLWKEISRRQTTVLIHPTLPKGYTQIPEQAYLPCPAFDFPHETTRCVSDIIMSGRRREFPDVNIILCHGGGTIPYLAMRIALTASAPPLHNPKTAAEILDEFKTFYYDSALCGTAPQFQLTVDFVPPAKLLYGTDHPYAPLQAVKFFTAQVEGGNWEGHEPALFKRDNAAKLFPRLA